MSVGDNEMDPSSEMESSSELDGSMGDGASADPTIGDGMGVATSGSEESGDLTDDAEDLMDEAKAHQSVAPAGNSGLESTVMPPPYGSNHLDEASTDLDES